MSLNCELQITTMLIVVMLSLICFTLDAAARDVTSHDGTVSEHAGGCAKRGASAQRGRLETAIATLRATLHGPGAARPVLAHWFGATGWRCAFEVRGERPQFNSGDC
jgi:hypothetical protein